MPRVWDTFMFAGEADMLFFRLEHLAGKVHRHVIAEADHTHRGVLRSRWVPLHWGCCLREYKDRIVYVPVSLDGRTGWAAERYQRDCAWPAVQQLGEVQPGDIVLISDLDEIPSDAALGFDWVGYSGHAVTLLQRTFHSAVDWEYVNPQPTSVLARAEAVHAPDATLSKLREDRSRYALPLVDGGGWHFSWLGSTEERRRKLAERTLHTDSPRAELDAIESGATWETGEHYPQVVQPVDVDETWPEYIYQRKCPATWFRPRRT